MTVPDEACTAAASAFIDCGSLVAALEAAAPYLRAQALEDAANGWWARDDVQDRHGAWFWLRARAAAERGGE